jgi:hypothetical protein
MHNDMIFRGGDKVAFVTANHELITGATVIRQFADPVDRRTRVEVAYTRRGWGITLYACPHKERVAWEG